MVMLFLVGKQQQGELQSFQQKTDSFSFMIERLLASNPPIEEELDEDQEERGRCDLQSIQSITDFMNCAGRTLPDNIRLWARRNLAVARSNEVSQEERHHTETLFQL